MKETCENCGREIGNLEKRCLHEGHVVCRKCHGDLSAPPLREEASGVLCPQCGGAQVISAAAAHEQGTMVRTSTHLSVGLFQDGVVPIVGESGGTEMSLATQKLSPPERRCRAPGVGRGLAALPLAVFGIGFSVSVGLAAGPRRAETGAVIFTLGVVGSAVLACIVWDRSRQKQKAKMRRLEEEDQIAFEQAMREWRATWYCRQCGYTFTLGPDGSGHQ